MPKSGQGYSKGPSAKEEGRGPKVVVNRQEVVPNPKPVTKK